MDSISWLAVAVFFGAAVALYASRKTSSQLGRVALASMMIVSLLIAVKRITAVEERNEVVWHEDAPNWTRMPLAVWWDHKVYEDYNQTIDAAIDLWNSRISCTVLWAAKDRAEAVILIHEADGTECGKETVSARRVEENPNAPASGWYCNGYFDIQTRRLDDVGVALRVFLHELGHGVGLAHDERGAMAPLALRPEPGDYPEYRLPSNKDVMSIRVRYCPAPQGNAR
jgi:hypothetical protein